MAPTDETEIKAFPLVASNGRVHTGIFKEPVTDINYRDFKLRTAMGKPANAFRRWFGFNQFQFCSVISEDIIVGVAIAHPRLATVSFAYFYEPKNARLFRYNLKTLPIGNSVVLSQQPYAGEWQFNFGRYHCRMWYDAGTGERRFLLNTKDGAEADIRFSEHGFEPMRICTPADMTGFAFTQKMVGIAARGHIKHPELGEFDLEQCRATATMDWTAGYLRRRCFWNWTCLSGILPDGRYVGVNGACGVNETSFTENCFWIDGKLHKVDSIKFDYDPEDLFKPWHITSYDGKLDLHFTPQHTMDERNNFIIMASAFDQMFGQYQGQLRTDSGEVITIDGLHGFTEEHYSKW